MIGHRKSSNLPVFIHSYREYYFGVQIQMKISCYLQDTTHIVIISFASHSSQMKYRTYYLQTFLAKSSSGFPKYSNIPSPHSNKNLNSPIKSVARGSASIGCCQQRRRIYLGKKMNSWKISSMEIFLEAISYYICTSAPVPS